MNQQNIDFVQAIYNNFKKGDIKTLVDQMSDNIDWELPQIPGVPFSGKRDGKQQVVQFFATVNESQESLLFEPREFIADDQNVVALGRYKWRVKSTDKLFEANFAHVFTVQNGKVVKFREFMDTLAAATAYSK